MFSHHMLPLSTDGISLSVAAEVKRLTIETLWPKPRHERGKWKELLEKNLVDFEPFPLEKNMVNELLNGERLQTKVIIIPSTRVN